MTQPPRSRARVMSGLTVLIVCAPTAAPALTVVSSTVSGLRLDAEGHVFGRHRTTRAQGGQLRDELELSRVRLGFNFYYLDLLKVQIEPNIFGSSVSLADAYLEITPHQRLRFRFGRFRAPFARIRLEARWDLPSLDRGLAAAYLINGLGFGDRKIGLMADLRAKKSFPGRPRLALGVFTDPDLGDASKDFAARLQLLRRRTGYLALSGYARDEGRIDGSHGFAGELAYQYTVGRWYLLLAGLLARTRVLGPSGATGADGTALSAYGLFAYSIPVGSELRLQPFVGAEAVDPSLRTRDDVGLAVRAGGNFWFRSLLRVGFQLERQWGDPAFFLPTQSRATVFLGVVME